MAPLVNLTHSIIQREASTSRGLGSKLHSVLQKAVNVVNVVKARPLNCCLHEETQADHRSLLLHSEMRKLSKGELLKRLSELKNKHVRRFLQEYRSQLYRNFMNGFLFCHVYEILLDKFIGLKSFLQVPNWTVFSSGKVLALTQEMLQQSLCGNDAIELFVKVSEYLEENDYVSEEIKPHVLLRLAGLKGDCKNHLRELTTRLHTKSIFSHNRWECNSPLYKSQGISVGIFKLKF
jgi:hypothetical protein